MKFSIRTIPAAAAMTAALLFGAQVQGQTTGQPATGAGDKAAVPAAPNTTGKTMDQRDTSKPMAKPGMDAGAAATGAHANTPAGPNTMGKSMDQRDAAKPMRKQGAMAGAVAGTGDAAAVPPGGSDKSGRQAGKSSKNKSDSMSKSDMQKSSTGKSGDPVRESDVKESTTTK